MSIVTEQRADGYICAISGSSRYGKTHWLKQRVAPAKRLLIFDTRGEYLDCQITAIVRSIPELASALRNSGKKEARICYWGAIEDFADWSILAYAWVQQFPAIIIAEETSDVTSPGQAPRGYGELLRKIMYYGGHLYGVTQRPQESDKTIWGNATMKHCHGFVAPADADYMSRIFGCHPDIIAGLQKYDFIEQIAGESDITRGRTVLKRG